MKHPMTATKNLKGICRPPLSSAMTLHDTSVTNEFIGDRFGHGDIRTS